MISKLAGPKDFWIGLIYLGFGAFALYFGWDYKFGTAGRMGPGYFPLVLAWMLVALGFASLVRAVLVKGSPIGDIGWLPLALILTAVVCFGFLLPRMGAFVALCTLCVISAMASDLFKYEAKATLGLILAVLACVVVFVNGLGVPMPLLGSWLEPILGPIIYPVTGLVTNVKIGGQQVGVLTSLIAIAAVGGAFLLTQRKA
jgi:Tripartite tricarboxylate transporter TctB family